MNLSVIIPVYNERENIVSTCQELLSALKGISDIGEIQLIIVDDHSSDNVDEVISQIRDARKTYLRLSRRSGSHVALRAGMAHVTGDACLCVSADGQEDLSCLKDMLSKWRGRAAIVWALRKKREEPWYIRKPAQAFYRFIFWSTGITSGGIDLSRADFFLLDRKVIEAVNKCPERNTSLFGLIAYIGFVQDFVEYNRRPRRLGESKWSIRRRIRLAKDWIIAFSGLPLKMIFFLGLFIALSGFLYIIHVIINAVIGTPAPGWSSMMAVILFIGGVQMIMLGVVGEYLWRNLDESRKRPLYFIERKIDEY